MTDEPATLLFIVQPAGSIEAFLERISRKKERFEQEELEKIYITHGMKLLGKPIEIS